MHVGAVVAPLPFSTTAAALAVPAACAGIVRGWCYGANVVLIVECIKIITIWLIILAKCILASLSPQLPSALLSCFLFFFKALLELMFRVGEPINAACKSHDDLWCVFKPHDRERKDLVVLVKAYLVEFVRFIERARKVLAIISDGRKVSVVFGLQGLPVPLTIFRVGIGQRAEVIIAECDRVSSTNNPSAEQHWPLSKRQSAIFLVRGTHS